MHLGYEQKSTKLSPITSKPSPPSKESPTTSGGKKKPEEFNYGWLGILPKKGDLSSPGNYRGIMMLEVGQKKSSNIMRIRLAPLVEELDHESQCGFHPKHAVLG